MVLNITQNTCNSNLNFYSATVYGCNYSEAGQWARVKDLPRVAAQQCGG